jgi:hypothetical protein
VFCTGLRVVLTIAGSPIKEQSIACLQPLLSAGHALNNKLFEELVRSSVILLLCLIYFHLIKLISV